jgi:hypothetical protein
VGFTWDFASNTCDTTKPITEPTPTPPEAVDDCHSFGWYWNCWESTCKQQPTCQLMPEPCEPGSCQGSEWCQCVPSYGPPVVVDAAKDGFRLTGLADGINFDLDGDGSAERLAWTAVGSDVAKNYSGVAQKFL